MFYAHSTEADVITDHLLYYRMSLKYTISKTELGKGKIIRVLYNKFYNFLFINQEYPITCRLKKTLIEKY